MRRREAPRCAAMRGDAPQTVCPLPTYPPWQMEQSTISLSLNESKLIRLRDSLRKVQRHSATHSVAHAAAPNVRLRLHRSAEALHTEAHGLNATAHALDSANAQPRAPAGKCSVVHAWYPVAAESAAVLRRTAAVRRCRKKRRWRMTRRRLRARRPISMSGSAHSTTIEARPASRAERALSHSRQCRRQRRWNVCAARSACPPTV